MAIRNWQKNANETNKFTMLDICNSAFATSSTFTDYDCEMIDCLTIGPDQLEVVCTFQNIDITYTQVGKVTPLDGFLSTAYPTFIIDAATALTTSSWTFTNLRLAAQDGQYTATFQVNRVNPIGQGVQAFLSINEVGVTGVTGTKSQVSIGPSDIGIAGFETVTGTTGETVIQGPTGSVPPLGEQSVTGLTAIQVGNTAIQGPSIDVEAKLSPFQILNQDPEGDSGVAGGGGTATQL